MKTGAGEDPFADEDTDERDGEPPSGTGGADSEGVGDTVQSARRGRSTGGTPPEHDQSFPGGRGEETDERLQPSELPYIARRNAKGDNVKTGRDTRRLFELRPEIAEMEERFLGDLARELGEEVPKTDAREAALSVVYDRPELVAEKLEEWGINYFEE